jgi:hypothetical protein
MPSDINGDWSADDIYNHNQHYFFPVRISSRAFDFALSIVADDGFRMPDRTLSKTPRDADGADLSGQDPITFARPENIPFSIIGIISFLILY